jgi:hypothetical protein
MGSVAGRFARVEPRAAARALVEGLLAPIERKNCWWLAEYAGRGGPQAMQRLLRTALSAARSPASCSGPDGANATNNARANATISADSPSPIRDHEVSLEY